jgi:hypothetical protein
MAQKAKRKGNAYKNGYKKYKLENKEEKNKIRQLEKHIKKFPNDKQTIDALEKIKKSGLIHDRKKPIKKGSTILTPRQVKKLEEKIAPYNRVQPPSRGRKYFIKSTNTNPSKTAGEQLSVLLGIPLKITKPIKPKFIVKKKR